MRMGIDKSAVGNNIVTGIVVGVMTGLILSGFSYGKQCIDHNVQRREQIEYLGRLVEEFQKDILSAEQLISESGDPSLINMPDVVRKLRWATLEYTYWEVVRTLEGRANTLTFDEKKQVLDAFSEYNLLRPSGPFADQGLLLDEAAYHQIFDELEAIKWLEIMSVDRTPIGPRPP